MVGIAHHVGLMRRRRQPRTWLLETVGANRAGRILIECRESRACGESRAGLPSDGVITIFVAFEVAFVALCVAAGSAEQRRSHFWLRVVLWSLALPALFGVLVGVARLNILQDAITKLTFPSLFFFGVISAILAPALLYHRPGSSPGLSDSDGGGGPGPKRPRSSPDTPRGAIPLADADQTSARVRDHNGPRFDDMKIRRPAHEPGRTPARTSA